MKSVDGVYITETELATTLADYRTAAAADVYAAQLLEDYPTTTELTAAHYTKTESDAKYPTKTALDTDISALGFMKTVNADTKYLMTVNAVDYY